jgi:hypothetical protein
MRWVLVDERISDSAERSLMREGFYAIRLPAASTLPEAIRSHPDTLIFQLGNEFLTTCDYGEEAAFVFSDIREYSENSVLHFSSEEFGNKFPSDAIFNAFTIGDLIFANKKNVSPKILEIAKKHGLTLVNVNQSYPNCSILKIDEQSAITSDRGLYKALSENGIDTLLIEEGHIFLPPYEYGFIGGASGVYGDKVMFFGNIDLHPDGEKIRKFIQEKGKKCISLSDEPLRDLGGMIFI